MKYENLEPVHSGSESMLFYAKEQVDNAVQELVENVKAKDDKISSLEETIRKIIKDSLEKQNESLALEQKLVTRISELNEDYRECILAEEKASSKSKDLALRIVELQDRIKELESGNHIDNNACEQVTSLENKQLKRDLVIQESIAKEKVEIINRLEAENKACREELDHEREQFAIALDEMEKKVQHARSYKNVLKHRAKTTMLWYRQAKKNLTEVEQDCAALYNRNKELEEKCENLESYISQLESKVASLERMLAKKIANPIDNN